MRARCDAPLTVLGAGGGRPPPTHTHPRRHRSLAPGAPLTRPPPPLPATPAAGAPAAHHAEAARAPPPAEAAATPSADAATGGNGDDRALRAKIDAAVGAALADAALFGRMNRFPPRAGSQAGSCCCSGRSAPPAATAAEVRAALGATRADRRGFARAVADFYGLTSLLPGCVVDMLGRTRPCSRVALTPIWPAAHADWGPAHPADGSAPGGDEDEELGVPGGFARDPRCFLLLPPAVREAFDDGFLVFVPAPDHASLECRVLRGAFVTPGLRRLHGRRLHLPRAAAGGVPHTRQLAYFALRAAEGWAAGGRPADESAAGAARAALVAGAPGELPEVEQRMVRAAHARGRRGEGGEGGR